MTAFTKLLVANRGEIASRIFRTCRTTGIQTVAVFSDADRDAPFVGEAHEAVAIGGASPADSYLRADAILDAARRTGAGAIHPGYGFLAESASFSRACAEAGLVFVGPGPEAMEAIGSKLAAKRLARRHGVPVLPWVELPPGADLRSPADLREEAERLGWPLLVKASAGGGGRGMRVARHAGELPEVVESCRREADAAFGDPTVFLEPWVEHGRHVEVQIVGDQRGHVASLFERECSVQRRHQKLVEEAPSPAVHFALRQRLAAAAVAVAHAAGYTNAGTVEFLLLPDDQFFLLEVNARLQVEHPVTEAVTGLDLVRVQLSVAAGEPLPRELTQPSLRGHAIEVRLYAEDAAHDDRPSVGRIRRLVWPDVPGVRIDAGVAEGSVVSPHYDALLAKLVAHAPTRAEAAARLAGFLERTRVHGVATNRDLLVRCLRDGAFLAGEIDTQWLQTRPDLRVRRAAGAGDRLHAVAAAVALAARRRSGARVLAFAPYGWRNNPSQPLREELVGPEGPLRVAWSRRDDDVVDVREPDVGPVRIHAASPDSVDLAVDRVRRRCHVAVEDDGVDVDSPLGHTRFERPARFTVPGAADERGSLRAPLPGRIVHVAVAEGQRVAAGDLLVVLEAMKMEHRVGAPAAGRVGEIRVEPGAQVEAGQVLAVLEADGE